MKVGSAELRALTRLFDSIYPVFFMMMGFGALKICPIILIPFISVWGI